MELSENALNIVQKRYFMEGETWETCCERVARVISQVESLAAYGDRFASMIYNLDFIPGGRVMRNAGRPRGSLFNCYLVPIADSIESIGTCKAHALTLWSEGGGVGINFSPLRPKGASVRGKGGESSGLVSFMEATDGDAETIRSGGQRRAAAIAIVGIRHPEVDGFIDAKLKLGTLNNFNISVALDECFLEAVENNDDWTFEFEGMKYGTVKARKIWNKILRNMVKSAEPGLINWNNLTKNNSYYFAPIVGTNPCGEVPLGAYECCNLGSLNLPHFLAGSQTNWKKLGEVVELAVRFLDDVIDVNRYTITEIEQNGKAARRIGLGTMGLGDYLFGKKIRYGSSKAISEIERLYKFIRDKAYETSIKLAIEKGTFPKYDGYLYPKASFIRKLPATLRMSLKSHGIRNCTLLSQAPTGTISLIPEVTSGIEPLYAKALRAEDEAGTRYYIHPIYKEYLEEGMGYEWFVDSFDITPEEHFETQATVQRYTDGAVSKTVNMPKGTTAKRLSKLLLEVIWDLKGVTVYVEGSRKNQPLTRISDREAFAHLKEASSEQEEASVQCKDGKCEL